MFAQIKQIRCMRHLHEKCLTNGDVIHLIVQYETNLRTIHSTGLITNKVLEQMLRQILVQTLLRQIAKFRSRSCTEKHFQPCLVQDIRIILEI